MTCCHPEAVSFENVAVARGIPDVVHTFPICVPVFPAPLKKRMPTIYPSACAWKITPSSTGALSAKAGFPGVALVCHKVKHVGQFAIGAAGLALTWAEFA